MQISATRHRLSRLLACLLPTGAAHANLLKLSVLSLAFTAFFLFVGDFTFPGGAHLFLMYAAQLLSGGLLPDQVAQRDAGYPLLMVLTGVPQTGSFLLLAIVQAIFSFLMPLLIYKIVARLDARAGYWAGVLAIVSLGPYQFMKWIHHDQPYLFFTMLGCWLFSLFVHSGKRSHFLWMGAAFILMSLTRPAGNWIYLILVAVGLFAYPRLWRFFLLNIVGFILLLSLYQWHRHHAFVATQDGRMPSYSGVQMLYNLIIKSDDFGVVITPDIGPNVQKLYDMTLASLMPSPGKSPLMQEFLSSARRNYSEDFYKRNFTGMDSKTMATKIFAEPNYEYYQYLSGVGKFEHDNLYLAAAKEIALAHPLFVAKYIGRSTWHMLAWPGFSDTRGNNNNMAQEGVFLLPFGHVVGNRTSIPPRGLKELDYSAAANVFSGTAYLRSYLSGVFAHLYRPFVGYTFPFALLAMLCSAYYLLRVRVFRASRPPFLERAMGEKTAIVIAGITGVHLYNCVVTAAFVDPSIRYHFFVLLLHLTLVAMGATIACLFALEHFPALRRIFARMPANERMERLLSSRAACGYVVMAGIFLLAAWVLHIETAISLPQIAGNS